MLNIKLDRKKSGATKLEREKSESEGLYGSVWRSTFMDESL